MSKTADVIIVGSGVIGCATAYYLAQKGTSVIVLDRDESIGCLLYTSDAADD